ncbi:hypothetical protein, partial [Undibacterium hunanense]|uniref:hypothetical protein n=1 Tax=Undibacterium hunanense TaxID=2762292 RepID=UPI001C9A42C5
GYLFTQFCVAALCASAAEKRDYEALYSHCQHLQLISFLFALSNYLNCCTVFTATNSFRNLFNRSFRQLYFASFLPALQREANYSKLFPHFASALRELFRLFFGRLALGWRFVGCA